MARDFWASVGGAHQLKVLELGLDHPAHQRLEHLLQLVQRVLHGHCTQNRGQTQVSTGCPYNLQPSSIPPDTCLDVTSVSQRVLHGHCTQNRAHTSAQAAPTTCSRAQYHRKHAQTLPRWSVGRHFRQCFDFGELRTFTPLPHNNMLNKVLGQATFMDEDVLAWTCECS